MTERGKCEGWTDRKGNRCEGEIGDRKGGNVRGGQTERGKDVKDRQIDRKGKDVRGR